MTPTSIVDVTTSTPWELNFDLRTLGERARRWRKRLFTETVSQDRNASLVGTCPSFDTTSTGQPGGPIVEPGIHFSSRPTALTKDIQS